MREATQSDGADVYDVCVADWARAVQVAHEIGAEFIAKLHQHTVCHRNVTPYGNTIWTETVVYPHESFFKEWDGSIYTPFEPGIKAERPSGAAQRNRRKQQGLDEKERT